jgi:peptidoglycan/LPS O-acetylase OafA/YrhL
MAQPQKNAFVHGARGIFAFSVLVFHICNSGLAPRFAPYGLPAMAGQGLQYGVELFFGISGIVILGARRRAASTALFLIERCTRIYPVLWATIAFILLGQIATHQPLPVTWSAQGATVLLGNVLAMTNALPLPLINPAAWTLSFEFCFYVLIAAFLSNNPRAPHWRKWCAVLAGIWILARQLRAVFFLSGILIAQGLFERRLLRTLIRVPIVWLIIFLACWSSALASLQNPINLAHCVQAARTQPWIPALMVIGWISGTLALAGLVKGEGLVARMALTPMVQGLGTISYSLYLWQTPIIAIVKHAMIASGLAAKVGNFAQPLLLLLAIAPVLIVATLSQRTLEVQMTNRLRLLLEGRRARRHAPA